MEDNDRYSAEFESTSDDAGIAYVENFYKRKFLTIRNEEVEKALVYAAEHGADGKSNLRFVRELLSGNLVFSTNKKNRKEIFLRAARRDQERTLVQPKP